MLRRPLFALLLVALPAGAAQAQDLGRVQEILDHLDTFMPPLRSQAVEPAPYVITPALSDDDARLPALPPSQIAVTALPPLQMSLEDSQEPGEADADPNDSDGQEDRLSEMTGEQLLPPADEVAESQEEPRDPDGTADLMQRLDTIDFEGLSRDAMLVPMVGADLAQVDRAFQEDALHQMARVSISAGDPAAFRKIMAAYIDPAWARLSDTETAYNIIAWMPDTAAFLDARIAAARYLGTREDVAPSDLRFLWKELRARVERVGRDDLMLDSLAGMAETGFVDLAIETIQRNTASAHERITRYVTLLDTSGAAMPADGLARLVVEIEALRGDIQSTRHDPNAIALAYWRAGLSDQAMQALSEELDPALRLRTRFEMLLSQR